jgi:hypothetical protein
MHRGFLASAFAIAVAVLAGACAGSTRTAPSPSTAAAEFHSREEGADLEAGPPVTENERVECKVAWQRFRSALEAATSGCASDEDCEAFETCHAVTRPNAGRLWKLKGEAQVTCRRVPGGDVELTCGTWAPSCRQGRCVRFDRPR